MFRWFMQRWIDKFERTWNYDASYMRDVLDADPRAVLAFSKVRRYERLPQGCAAGALFCRRHRRRHGGGLRSLHAAGDRHGAAPRRRAGDLACCRRRATSPQCPTRWRSPCALPRRACDHAPEADDLREEVVRQFGKRGLVSLAFALTASAPLSDAEICAGPRPGLHPPHGRRRNPAGAARVDGSRMNSDCPTTTDAAHNSRRIGAR